MGFFRPGVVAGNVHTPAYVAGLGRLIGDRFRAAEQDAIGRVLVAEFICSSDLNGVALFGTLTIKRRSRRATY
jgi:hypothetical protein